MTWQGMVIHAPLGADIRAVAAGTVVFADWLRGFGLLAVVDHGDGHMSLYGYADALYKRTGERVEGGETIAAAGQSGGQQDVGPLLRDPPQRTTDRSAQLAPVTSGESNRSRQRRLVRCWLAATS